MRAKRKRAHVGLALLLAFSFLIQLGTPVFHIGHVHRYCAEHDGFEEAPQGAALPGQQPGGLAIGTAEAAGTHLRCEVFVLAAAHVRPSWVAQPCLERALGPRQVYVSECTDEPIAILLRAPKLSPPVVRA